MTVSELTKDGLRALFAISLHQEFFSATHQERGEIGLAIKDAFADLEKRFGTKVLGTFDDDLLQVGTTRGYPFISYILVDLPGLEAAIEITNLIRTPFKEGRLTRYLSIDARIGHPLFFGNE